MMLQGGLGGKATSGGYHQFLRVYLADDDLKVFEEAFAERGNARFREAMEAFWAASLLGPGKKGNARMKAVAAGWALLSPDERMKWDDIARSTIGPQPPPAAKRSRGMDLLAGGGSPALARTNRRKGVETNYAVLKAAEFFVALRRDALRPFRGGHFRPVLEALGTKGVFKEMKRPPPGDPQTRHSGEREETHATAIFWEEGHGPTWSELARLQDVAMTPPINLAGLATNTGRIWAQRLQKLFVQDGKVLISNFSP